MLAPPETETPAALTRGRGQRDVEIGPDKSSKHEAKHQAIQSWDEVDDLSNELEWMSLWRDVLQWKFNSAHRRFEPAHLEMELASFKREGRALANSYRGRA